MRIIGHGIDVIETQRVAQLLDTHGERFLARCYTEHERNYAQNRRRQVEHLAGRFAAKEAIFKALGTGWSGGIAWTDAEVVRLKTGQPTVALHGVSKQVADDMGITRWWLSISHTDALAMASVIAEGAD